MKNQFHETQVISYKGVNILAIYDPDTTQSSCAISVNVGSIDQPDKIPGLAHMLQHMIYISSKSYPKPNEYSQFLATHSGYENAQTCDFFTNYYFEASNQAFPQALERVVDAFCDPLLNPQNFQSEIQAINEQFILSSSEDDDRLCQIINSFSNPPLSRFSMGNRKSLQIPNIEQHLRQFHRSYRSNSQVNIVIYCPKPIQNIQRFQKFNIEYNQQKLLQKLQNQFNYQAFSQKSTNKLIRIKSILSQSSIKINLFLNLSKNQTIIKQFTQCSSYQEKLRYLQTLNQFNSQFHQCMQYIVCHDSDSVSLIGHLDKFQEVEQIQFDIEEMVPFTQYMITITLHLQQDTYPKNNKIEKIYEKVMQYLGQSINQQNIQRAFKQVSYLADLQTRNLQIDDMEDYLCDQARQIYEFGLQNQLDCQKMQNKTILTQRQQLLTWCIRQIASGRNKIIVHSSPDQPQGKIKKQPYFQTPYSVTQFDHQITLKTKQTLFKKLIPPNPLLPLQQVLYPSINNPHTPILLSSNIHFYNTGCTIMRGGVKLLLHNDQGYVFNKLFCQFMDLYIDDLDYGGMAETIGVEYFFDYQQGSLYLYIFGYNQLVMYILEQIRKKMAELVISLKNYQGKNSEDLNDIFDQAVQNLQQELQDYYQQQMDYLTDKIRDQVLIQTSPPLNIIQKQIKKMKKKKFIQRSAKLIGQSFLQWVVVGNFDQKQIQKLIQNFEKSMENPNKLKNQNNQKVKQIKVMKISNLPLNNNIKLEVRHETSQVQASTCLTYYQGGLYSQKLFWILNIMSEYLQQPFYNHIRLQKKLSYEFEINQVNTRGILGFSFMLTSSKIDPETISKQIQQFLNQYASDQVLKTNLSQNFQKVKKALANKYSQPFPSVEDCFDFICDEVVNRTFYYEQNERHHIEQVLKTITFEQVLATVNKIFKGPRIQILFVSKQHKKSYLQQKPKVTPLEQIKKNAEYYEDPLSTLSFSFKKH